MPWRRSVRRVLSIAWSILRPILRHFGPLILLMNVYFEYLTKDANGMFLWFLAALWQFMYEWECDRGTKRLVRVHLEHASFLARLGKDIGIPPEVPVVGPFTAGNPYLEGPTWIKQTRR